MINADIIFVKIFIYSFSFYVIFVNVNILILLLRYHFLCTISFNNLCYHFLLSFLTVVFLGIVLLVICSNFRLF